MALIVCPECGKKFSDYAPACPDCGMPTEKIGRHDQEPPKAPPAAAETASVPEEAALQEPKNEPSPLLNRGIRTLGAAPVSGSPSQHSQLSHARQSSTLQPRRNIGSPTGETLPDKEPPNPWHRNGSTPPAAEPPQHHSAASFEPPQHHSAASVEVPQPHSDAPAEPPKPRPAPPAYTPPTSGGRTHPPAPPPEPIRPMTVTLPKPVRVASGGSAAPGVLAILFTLLAALCLFGRELLGASLPAALVPWLRLAAAVFFLVALVLVTLAFARGGRKALAAVACVLLVLFAASFVYFKQPFKALFADSPQPVSVQDPQPAPAQRPSSASTPAVTQAETEPAVPAEAQNLRLGETLTTSYMTLTLDAFEISEGYSFSHKDGSVTYKTGIDCPGDMRLLTLRGSFTNKTGKELYPSNDPVKGLIIVDGNEYTTRMRCFNVAEADTIMTLASQRTVDYFLCAEVPETVALGAGTCTIRLAFAEQLDTSTWFMDFDEYPNQYVLEALPGKTQEELAEESVQVLPLNLNSVVSTADYDFTLEKVEFTYELKPRNTSSFYISYPAESGKVYLHLEGTFSNTSRRDLRISDLPIARVDYNGGYGYDGFALVPDGDNRFDWVSSYVACTPLESCVYHCLVEMPESVAQSDAPLFFTMQIGNALYRYDVR